MLLQSYKEKLNSTSAAALYLALNVIDLKLQLESLKFQEECGLLRGEEYPEELGNEKLK